MSKVIGKMSAGFGYTMQSMKNASANCKVDGRVCGKEKEIRDFTAEIGNLTILAWKEKAQAVLYSLCFFLRECGITSL